MGMVRVNLHRTIVVYLAWLGFIGAALGVVLSDAAPAVSAYVRPDNLFHFLLYSELFFVLVVWPLFIPKVLQEDREAPRSEVHVLLLQVVLLFVFVLPLAFVCQTIANLTLWTFFKGQLQVAVFASFVAALYALGTERNWRLSPYYYLGMFLSAAGLPFLYYLVLEFTGASPGFLAIGSPFWAASRLDESPHALIQCAIFGSAAVGLLLGPSFLKRTRTITS